jgi:curved DNA-binding protein CbpA
LQNYYEILGLSPQANLSEIKIAFRKLAKLYHPDKNPNGIEHFTKILKAYEILSNHNLKSSYDYKLTYHQQHSTVYTPKSSEKQFTFSEQELKRRQYYNEHIKKHAKKYKQQNVEAQLKTNYNEYKYILFATPLAVLLFLLVVSLATPNGGAPQNSNNIAKNLKDTLKNNYDKKN